MKKIKLIVKLLPLLILFFMFTGSSFAQGINGGIYNFSNIIKMEQVKKDSVDKIINLPPFTTVTIKAGSFQNEVVLFVYEGNFDKIKDLLPKGQSPISSYYLVFRNQKGITVFPSIPLTIESVNNYSNTDTFYYPVLPEIKIDTSNQKNWSGNVKVNAELPVEDSAFIVATDKILDKNDPALNAGKISQTPQATPFLQNKTKQNNQNGLLITLGALMVVVGVICVVFWVLWKKQKKII